MYGRKCPLKAGMGCALEKENCGLKDLPGGEYHTDLSLYRRMAVQAFFLPIYLLVGIIHNHIKEQSS